MRPSWRIDRCKQSDSYYDMDFSAYECKKCGESCINGWHSPYPFCRKCEVKKIKKGIKKEDLRK